MRKRLLFKADFVKSGAIWLRKEAQHDELLKLPVADLFYLWSWDDAYMGVDER